MFQINSFRSGALLSLYAPLTLILTSPLVARLLGPEDRGKLALLLIPSVLLDVIALAGLPNALFSQSHSRLEAEKLIQSYKKKMNALRRACILLAAPIAYVIHLRTELNGLLIFILLNSFLFAQITEVKKAYSIVCGNFTGYNLDRLITPTMRIVITIIALKFSVRDPLVFALLQLGTGVFTTQLIYRGIKIPEKSRGNEPLVHFTGKSSNHLWAILETMSYWIVLFLVGLILPFKAFGIFAIAIVIGEVLGSFEKYLINYRVSSRNILINSSGPGKFRLRELILVWVCFCVGSYFLVPTVFGSSFAESRIPSVFCLTATLFRILMRLNFYHKTSNSTPVYPILSEGFVLTLGLLLLIVLSQHPTALTASVIFFTIYSSGFFFSLYVKRKTDNT